MKKRLFALLMACLMTFFCAQAEENTEGMVHSDTCQKPGVCQYCGATEAEGAVMSWMDHVFDWDNPVVTETDHTLTCTLCGMTQQGVHWTYCSNGETCDTCGAANVIFDYVEHELNWDTYAFDEQNHYYECTFCGSQEYPSFHESSCIDKETCMYCGAVTADGAVMQGTSHDVDMDNMVYDQFNHYASCRLCGEMVVRSPHWVMCNMPGVCTLCGAENVIVMGELAHSIMQGEAYEEGHELICVECGFTYIEPHYTFCDDPGVCMYCWWEGDQMELAHGYNHAEPAGTDEQEHWYVCSFCGEEAERGAHAVLYIQPDVCTICGRAVTAPVAETAVVEALEEGAIPENAAAVVYNQTPMLYDGVDVKTLLTVRVFSENEEVMLGGKVRIRIDWAELSDEDAEETVASYRMVQIGEDGSLTDAAYEIADGKLVFETAQSGAFAMIPAE